MKLHFWASLALIAAAAIWGSSYVVVKDIVERLSPSYYLCIRFGLSVAIVFIIFHRPITDWYCSAIVGPQSNIRTRMEYAVPGLFLVLAYFTQAYGIRTTSPAVAAFLTSLFFAITPIFSLMHGTVTELRQSAIPIVLALIGTALITGAFSAQFSPGDVLLVLCAVGYAGQIFHTGRLAARRHVAVAFVAQGFAVFLAGAVVSSLRGEFNIRALDSGMAWRVAYLAFVATVLCFLLQMWAQKYVHSTHAGVILAVEPVAALAISVVFGRESLTGSLIVGASFIIAAALMSVLQSAKYVKTPASPQFPVPRQADESSPFPRT